MPNPALRCTRPRPTRFRVVLIVLGLFLAGGCGADDGFDDGQATTVGDGPRVADARFAGSFEVTGLVVEGTAIEVAQRPIIEIEPEFGDLTVLPGCNTYFGSFTLAEDGDASFTVTGGSGADCGQLTGQEDAILGALAEVDRWAATDAGFRFDGPGSSITVVGQAG